MTPALLLGLLLAASYVGTAAIRRYALNRGVLDVPNDRSSHTRPTPRGGGVAIAATFLAGVAAAMFLGFVARPVGMALSGAGLIVAIVGFMDDHAPIAARWRLSAHFVGAAWALAWLGGAAPVEVFGRVVHLGLVGAAVAAVALVWLLNLYNFMDGIDGIAGIEAVTVCLGAVILDRVGSSANVTWLLPAMLAMAVLGFLALNFPPARIFMGDSGSGFLGVVLGILALEAASRSPRLLWSWMILLGVFIVDATVTLIRRHRRGERVYEAHRSHAYQHAAYRLQRHRPVTVAVALINVLWLFPWAVLVATGRLEGVIGTAIAYAPLIAVAFWFRAGLPSP